MSILRRLFAKTAPAPEVQGAAWHVIPARGYFEVAGVIHHTSELARVFPPRPSDDDPLIVEVDAEIERDRGNRHDPNAVSVRIHGQLAGYIPRAHAPAWATFLDRLSAEGLRAKATARVWIGHSAYYVNLRAHESADYRTPREAEQERELAEEQRARAAAERDQQREEKQRLRAGREALEQERRAAGKCPSCGSEVSQVTGQRGRPRVFCDSCR